MSNFSNYLQNANLNWLKGTAFPTLSGSVYCALFNGDPTDTGSGGTEVTTTIRTAGRLAVTWGTIATNNTLTNSAIIDFGNAAAGATFTHFALFDASSAGNLLHSAAITGGSVTVSTGTDVNFPIGSLVIVID